MEMSVDTSIENAEQIKPKMHFMGKVVKTFLAGAIVDIGLEKPAGLHISQIVAASPEQAVHRVEDVLSPGQEVEVWVRRIKDGRIELTMLKPLGLEWRDIKIGMVVNGSVVRLEKFGAFVEIGAERPGLVHISEMAHGYVKTPGDVVKEGDEVEAQVLEVNRRKKQIKLSLKALLAEPIKEEPIRLIEEAQKEKAPRRRKPRRGEEPSAEELAQINSEANQTAEPDPTFMELAMREAMEKARSRKVDMPERSRRNRSASREQEDLLARTLEHKVKTS
jgi:small subunit ribosomal protein S1